MKIIVEPGDEAYFGLQPGTYEMHVSEWRATVDVHSSGMIGTLGRTAVNGGGYTFDIECTLTPTDQLKGTRFDRIIVDDPASAPPVCEECKGTGFYESPMTLKQTPCSRGCPAP